MNDGVDIGRNVNRLDNGLSLTDACRSAWDAMAFYLSVDWDTYDEESKEEPE